MLITSTATIHIYILYKLFILKVIIDQIIQEYLLSSDIDEATRCIRELESPLFHYEVIKRALTLTFDRDNDQQERISNLIKHLSDLGYVTQAQIVKGFDKVKSNLADLTLGRYYMCMYIYVWCI